MIEPNDLGWSWNFVNAVIVSFLVGGGVNASSENPIPFWKRCFISISLGLSTFYIATLFHLDNSLAMILNAIVSGFPKEVVTSIRSAIIKHSAELAELLRTKFTKK